MKDEEFTEFKCLTTTDIALLKQSGTLVKMVLPLLFTIAMSAAGFAWTASSKIAVLESRNEALAVTIKEQAAEISTVRKEFTTTANWVEGNFVSKDVFESHTRGH